MARCAVLGGAAAVRVNGAEDVRAVKRAVSVPIIALAKTPMPARQLITADADAARDLASAGADMIALEVTGEAPGGIEWRQRLLRQVRAELRLPVIADVSNLEEGLAAWEAGAELVGTTLSGYTRDSRQLAGPDLELARALVAHDVRTAVEGRVQSPAEVASALSDGVWTVVVGSSITDPVTLTRRFVAAAAGAAS
jgi:N-acylglucosamine-6-phosphate 2-epimerase